MAATTPSQSLDWYDSLWLESYLNVRNFLSQRDPRLCARFIETFEALKTSRDFSTPILKNLVDAKTLSELTEICNTASSQDLKIHELTDFGRLVIHNHDYLTALQSRLTPLVGEIVGEEVEANYNFLSLYMRHGVCGLHLDSPEAKWTLDLCIAQSEPWPLYVSEVQAWPEDFAQWSTSWQEKVLEDPGITFSEYSFNPGEAVIFSGSAQWHYRDKIPQSQADPYCFLAFFHFIPKGFGEFIHPERWAEHFDCPELEEVISAHGRGTTIVS